MKLFKDIRNFIDEDKFKIIISLDYIDIINYEKIISLTDNNLSIKANKIINISGDKLKYKKLLDNEIVLFGDIKKVTIDE